MTAGVFLIGDDGSLRELQGAPYDSEALLQRLLAQYPRLLGGARNASGAARWLLVSRELGIPDGEGQPSRWSLDHLFLDQDAIPTLVECKRATDSRIRREVVGQMLDYAANVVVHWPPERMQRAFQDTVAVTGQEPDSVLAEFLGAQMDAEAFWQQAKTNLRAGRIRLVFLADEIPVELKRIIEFLNEQMDPAEVLGIELRQFVGENVRSLIPSVIGRTVEASDRKSGGTTGRQWDEQSLLATLAGQDASEASAARELLSWAKSHALRLWWGRGIKDGSCYLMQDVGSRSQYLVAIRTGYRAGYIQFQLAQMIAPFDSAESRSALAARLSGAIGKQINPEAKYPSVPLTEVASRERVKSLLEVFEWVYRSTLESHEPVGR